jgi:uncharacterized protein (TIGR00159 family)
LPIRIWDVLDIIIVALLLYAVYRLLKGSIALNIVVGIILLYVVWGIVGILDMPLLSEILGQFVSVGFIALIIIFQPEIRRFLLYIGNTTLQGRSGILGKYLKSSLRGSRERNIKQIGDAIWHMASEKVGALIVLPKQLNIEGYADSGQIINAEITEELIRSIFQKNSPLHDGAMVIYGGKIHAASCVLPISSNPDLPSALGLRHRAGLGSSENSDTVSFIVSEETGDISVAVKGKLQRGLSKKMLLTILDEHYN